MNKKWKIKPNWVDYVQIPASEEYSDTGVVGLEGVVEVLLFPVHIGITLDSWAFALFTVWALTAMTASKDTAIIMNAVCLIMP